LGNKEPGDVKHRAVVVTDTNIVVPLAKDVRIELRPCPAGTFAMSNAGDGTHEVTITRPFWIGNERISRTAYSVFNAEYDALTEGEKKPTDYVTGRDRAEPFLAWLS